MSPVALWGVAGLVLCAAEMVAPGVFLLWLGLAAIGTSAVAALFALGWHGQLVAFVALALALVGLAAARMRGRPRHDAVNAPSAGLIGATCTAGEFRAGEGRVHLRDGTWPARIAGNDGPEVGPGAGPAAGDVLLVVGLEGTTLLVSRQAEP